ncbi:hypothetical protein LINPERHAP2_LOCUS21087, partial [Linum perenne]
IAYQTIKSIRFKPLSLACSFGSIIHYSHFPFFHSPLIPCGCSSRLTYRKSVCGNLPIAIKQVVLAIMSKR